MEQYENGGEVVKDRSRKDYKQVNQRRISESHGDSVRASKFDPYIEDIRSLISMGYTVSKMADTLSDMMDDFVDESALYGFMRSRELHTLNYPGGLNREYSAPQCNRCENCFEVVGLNEKTIRMCGASRLISWSVKTSPGWCPKREKQAV